MQGRVDQISYGHWPQFRSRYVKMPNNGREQVGSGQVTKFYNNRGRVYAGEGRSEIDPKYVFDRSGLDNLLKLPHRTEQPIRRDTPGA